MKKSLFTLLALIAVSALVACEPLETEIVGFSVETVTLEVDDTETLTLINPRELGLDTITFASENSAVATVNDAGVVTAVAPGITAITLTYEDVIVDFVLVNVYASGDTVGSAREIVMRVDNDTIQWAYEGETDWNDLLALGDLQGADGAQGADGDDGVSIVDIFTETVDIESVTFDTVTSFNTQDADRTLVIPSGSTDVYLELEANHPTQGNLYDIDFTFTDYNGASIIGEDLEPTEVDLSGNIIEQVLYTDSDITVYYSGYGSGGPEGPSTSFPPGLEYVRVVGTLAYDMVFDIVYVDGEDDSVDFEYRVLYDTDWSTFEPFQSQNDQQLNLVFEFSNDERVELNFSGILEQSLDLGQINVNINQAQFINIFNLIQNQAHMLYNVLLNVPYNGSLAPLFLEESVLNYTEGNIDLDALRGSLDIELQVLLSNPAYYDDEFYLDREFIFALAFQASVCYVADFEFGPINTSLFGFECEGSPNIIDILSIMLGLTYEDEGGLELMDPSLFFEYVLMLDSIDETLYYQYLMDNPHTGWNLYNVQDRLEFNRALANNALNVSVIMDKSHPGIDNLSLDWMDGGDEGFFYPNYQTLEVGVAQQYSYLHTSAYFATPAVNNFYSRVGIADEFITFTVPYGAAFPLPAANQFDLNTTINGEDKTYVLDGYRYANFFLENYEPVLTHGELSTTISPYTTFGSNYEGVGFGPDFATYYLLGEFHEASSDIFDAARKISEDRFYAGAGQPFLFIEPIITEVFTVTFLNEDTSVYDTVTNIRSTETITLPLSPSKAGYTFEGWSADGGLNLFTETTPVTSNITLSPVFIEIPLSHREYEIFMVPNFIEAVDFKSSYRLILS